MDLTPSLCLLVPLVSPLVSPLATGQEPRALWLDRTDMLLGETGQWTNRVELADIDGDGRVDLLFANGGDYSTPGAAELNRVFLNRGPGKRFEERTTEVLGEVADYARVIKVRDLNADGVVDILVGNTFQTRSRLFLGTGEGSFDEVTQTHLPGAELSVGDVTIGDVDGDGDLDIALADWGAGNNMTNAGGRTRLWLNDGTAHFHDATETNMPEALIRFSWDLDFVDVDNDHDLDLTVSCKQCNGSRLFLGDGMGRFTPGGRLPRYTNNYELEAMDMDGDGLLDLVTVNDGDIVGGRGSSRREHVFQNAGEGRFRDMTSAWWPSSSNLGEDDNMVSFLDYDSDGDADFLLGSLTGADRLLINDGTGRLTVASDVFEGPPTPGTLALVVADLDGDGRLDAVQAQGEHPRAVQEKVYLGTGLTPDSAPPSIGAPQIEEDPDAPGTFLVRARVHDSKSPCMPHDWRTVEARWRHPRSAGSVTGPLISKAVPMNWYGEFLWRARLTGVPEGARIEVRAVDAAGNESIAGAAPPPAAFVPQEIVVGELRFDALAAGPKDGELVLLLHGFPQTAYSFRNQIPALAAAGYRVVAPDQRGYSAGARPADVEAYAMSHLVEDVAGIADALGRDRFHVVGHDWGAAVAWFTALSFPKRVRTVTALSVPHPFAFSQAMTSPDSDQAQRSGYMARLREEGFENVLLADDAALLAGIYAGAGLSEVDTQVYLDALGTPAALGAALNWYRAMGVRGNPREFTPIAMPALYIWSDADPTMSREGAELTADFVEGPYRFEVLEGIGHWIPEEAAPQVNRMLLEHLGGR